MNEIFREIEGDLRRASTTRFLTRYGLPIALTVALLLTAAGVWFFQKSSQNRRSQAAGGGLEQALFLARDGGKSKEAETAFSALAQDAPDVYRTLARVNLASQIGQRDKAAGASGFDAIAEDAAVSPTMRDLARLRAAMLRFDQLDKQVVTKALDALAKPDNVWRHSARELLGLSALKVQAFQEAGGWFDQLASDPQTPQSMRARVDAYLALVKGAALAP